MGITLCTFRTITPIFSETYLGIPPSDLLILATFVIFFGLVKAILNLYAGFWADQYGRKPIMLLGLLLAIPLPFFIYFASNWYWMITMTILLGIQQGICWSMTQIAKIDISPAQQRGRIMGFNEFFGYVGVGISGYLASYISVLYSSKVSLVLLTSIFILLGFIISTFWMKETQPSLSKNIKNTSSNPQDSYPWRWWVFKQVSWQDKKLFAICQAALIEKFIDVLVWVFYPVFLVSFGLNLQQSAFIIAVYAMSWGSLQLLTGALSDYLGRLALICSGMLLGTFGISILLWQNSFVFCIMSAFITGTGMAMLYPTLGAALSDYCPIEWRSSAMGIYRFWRDLGYTIGALILGILSLFSSNIGFIITTIALSMVISVAILIFYLKAK